MNNPFVGLKQISEVDTISNQMVWKLANEDCREKRNALYAMYTPLVDPVLDQLTAAYRPGLWKNGIDSDHKFCCHSRWYAGPEETGFAHFGDHSISRRIEIELALDYKCNPTGFKILYYDSPGKSAHVGLSQHELVNGIKAVFPLGGLILQGRY